MSKIPNGGPAFPLAPSLHEGGMDSYWTQHPQPGMTLRDYFAAKAMQALIAAGYSSADEAMDARRAYAVADAMLAAREVHP